MIDLAALRHNLRVFRERAPNVGLVGVVKANAYGHGAIEISRTLVDERIDGLAVAIVPEAIALRNSGITCPIMVFGAVRPQSIDRYVEYDLEAFITSVESLSVIRNVPGLRVHLHVDTGMGRLGIQPNEVARTLSLLDGMPGIELAGISTHLASAANPDRVFSSIQWSTFAGVLRSLGSPPAPLHLASSGAFFTVPESVDPDIIGYARPGIGLYGLMEIAGTRHRDLLKPVMTLVSEVAQIKIVEADTPISYDGRWRAPKRTRIVTVAAGYADGYPRNLTNKGVVGIRGSLYPVVGAVCMDLLMVDVGPPGEEDAQIQPADPVVLFGSGGPSAIRLAELSDTIPYELVCRVAPRIPRVYMNSDETPETSQ